MLQGCSHSATDQARSKLPIYAADVKGGAKICTVPQVNPTAGQSQDVAIKLGNDGGWCGLPVHQDGPAPFDAGLLTARPAHGTITIHAVGDDTRIDYTPDRGYAGTDTFSVKLLPGSAVLKVTATVTAPGG
jgi:hypothetical protein